MSGQVDRSILRGVDAREVLRDEHPAAVSKFVFVCSWCPDAQEQTAAARAHGFEASHGICPTCEAKLWAEMDADSARRV